VRGLIYPTRRRRSSYPLTVRAFLPLLLVVVGACGGGGQQTQAAPSYTPENSPEPPTACPIEHREAREARERAIGEEGMTAQDEAAKAVFELAECERRLFDEIQLLGSDPTVIEELKVHFQSARNLYTEVVNYAVPRWVVAGHTRLGDLFSSFGGKIATLAPSPAEKPDPETAAMDERLTMEAGKAYREALDAAETWPAMVNDDPLVGTWVLASCRGVDRWQSGLSARYRICNAPAR
jgi:hypothetical protein